MKKILAILALASSVTLGYSQGTVNFSTISATYAVSTNNVSIGKTATAAKSYYYALLIQTYTGAAANTINQNPLNGWTFSGAYATNSSIIAGGISGGNQTISGWAAGTQEYVEVVGWSAALGTTWAAVDAALTGGGFGSNLYGVSSVGVVTSGGGGTPAAPPAAIFAPTGVASGWQLSTVPEPTTMALIGIGGLGLAMIRRRK